MDLKKAMENFMEKALSIKVEIICIAKFGEEICLTILINYVEKKEGNVEQEQIKNQSRRKVNILEDLRFKKLCITTDNVEKRN